MKTRCFVAFSVFLVKTGKRICLCGPFYCAVMAAESGGRVVELNYDGFVKGAKNKTGLGKCC